MKVLLSIKPEFAPRIFDGSKKYEFRRTIFKRTGITTIVVYVSYPIKKVIGEFEIARIIHDKPDVIWARTKSHAGITEKNFRQYFSNRLRGYAIEVRQAKRYDIPIPLSKLSVSCPPQSFMYLPQ